MPTNNNPDLLYLKSREQLLPYEDARFNALIQAVADFYSTRNDQSIWGNFLRALAIELSTLDYDYSYDIVNKDPSLLTPPDIRRRWAAGLYISANWPSPQQFDIQYKQMLVQLLSAYRLGTTVEAIQNVIFAYTGINIQVVELYRLIGNGIYDQSDRNALAVSVNVGSSGSNPLTTVTSLAQLQSIVQSLYGAIALAKPAHVGIEFTTIFGEGEALDCMLSPTNLTDSQFLEIDSVSQGYYSTNGYAPFSPALFWKASTAFVIGNLLRDYNGNFQLLISTGAFPNVSGTPNPPAWSLVSQTDTTDGDLTWINISPSIVSTNVTAGVLTVVLSYPVGLTPGTIVTLISLTGANSTQFNGVPLTVATVSGATFTAATTATDYVTEAETTGTATFPLPQSITAIQFNQLNTQWRSLYQLQWLNTNCQDSGISDFLRIFVIQSEQPPFGPMLIQAPVLNPANPKTTIAAYGRLLPPTLTPTQWAALPLIYVNVLNGMSNGTFATYTYVPTTQFLHEGEIVTITTFPNPALNVTAKIQDVVNMVANISSTSVTSDVVTINAPNFFTGGMLVTFAGLASATYLNGQSLIVQAANPRSFTVNFTHANYAQTADTGTAEVSTFQIPNTETIALQNAGIPTNAGLVTPTLQAGYYLNNGNYVLGQAPVFPNGAGTEGWAPNMAVFQGQIIVDSNGNTQVALNAGTTNATAPHWMTALQASTQDNNIFWRNVGVNFFSAPNTWVGILNFNVETSPLPFTGEVGNWDPLHQYGLVAPRLNQVWEISGNPQDIDQIFGLY